jgi:hypothetical protein
MYAFRDSSTKSSQSSLPRPTLTSDTARIYLDIPFAQKDEAKALGARWDNSKRKWYAPNGEPALLTRWAIKPVVPLSCLEGEVRDYGPTTLVIDFVPKTCWCKKIRYALVPEDFKRLEGLVINRTNRQCEACGVKDPKQETRMEVQARWEYDVSEGKHVQRLVRLMAMCPDCHEVTHFGKACMDGRRDAAMVHLQKAANMSAENAQAHADAAYTRLRELNEHEWQLDLSLFTNNGLSLATARTFKNTGYSQKLKTFSKGRTTTAGNLRKRAQHRAENEVHQGSDELKGFAFRK